MAPVVVARFEDGDGRGPFWTDGQTPDIVWDTIASMKNVQDDVEGFEPGCHLCALYPWHIEWQRWGLWPSNIAKLYTAGFTLRYFMVARALFGHDQMAFAREDVLYCWETEG